MNNINLTINVNIGKAAEFIRSLPDYVTINKMAIIEDAVEKTNVVVKRKYKKSKFPYVRWTEENDEKLNSMRLNGMTIKEMAKYMNCSKMAIKARTTKLIRLGRIKANNQPALVQ